MCLYIYTNTSAFTTIGTDIQLEIGNTKSPFEEHLETQIQANIPEGEFIGKIDDTYKDILKVEYNEKDGQYHLMLHKCIRKKVLNGSETINNYNLGFGDATIGFSIKLTDKNQDVTYNKLGTVCNMFTFVSTWANDEEGYNNDLNTIIIRIKKSRLESNDIAGFKTWLSTHNTEVYYPLATPYIVDLGIVDMPITYNEVTNLFTDSDLMPTINAKYYRNFITTIQNLQLNEKALKQELVDINTRLTVLENAQTITTQESEVVE